MSSIPLQSFEDAINTPFTLDSEQASFDMTLCEVNTRGDDNSPYECFSLVFDAQGPLLEQQIYSLKHATIGTLELFLVPIGGENEQYQYEAIINRERKQ